MEEHKMANRDPKMKQQRATMARRRRMAIMQGRVMPRGLMAAHGGGSMVGPTAGQQPPQQAPRMLVPQQPGVRPQTPQRPGNISPDGLQDLLRTLRSPSSPQQQQQVLNILKSNPQLMAAFIKQRTARRLQQAQTAPPPAEQLVALCGYHAKHCQENKCPVPSCLNIKQKLRQRLRQQQLRLRLQQAQMLRWRMAAMQGRVMQNSQHPPTA